MTPRLKAFLLAAAVTYVLAAVAATQSVLARLGELGVRVSLAERLQATGHDLLGMVPWLFPLIGIAMCIGFVVVTALTRVFERPWPVLFAVAGGIAMVTLHVVLYARFQVHPLPAARTAGGLAIQGLAGTVGGYVFARVRWAAT